MRAYYEYPPLASLDRYVDFWRRQETAMTYGAPGIRTLEKDLNVAPPLLWHFGPPPAGWGKYIDTNGPEHVRYARNLATGRGWQGLGSAPISTNIDDTVQLVNVLWLQERLCASGISLTRDGVWGPETSRAIQLFVNTQGPSNPAARAQWTVESISSSQAFAKNGIHQALNKISVPASCRGRSTPATTSTPGSVEPDAAPTPAVSTGSKTWVAGFFVLGAVAAGVFFARSQR